MRQSQFHHILTTQELTSAFMSIAYNVATKGIIKITQIYKTEPSMSFCSKNNCVIILGEITFYISYLKLKAMGGVPSNA